MTITASLAVFFAPSPVRPTSPVAKEQFLPFTRVSKPKQPKAGEDDRNPPSQDCSPHPGKEKHQNKPNTTENAENGEGNAGG